MAKKKAARRQAPRRAAKPRSVKDHFEIPGNFIILLGAAALLLLALFLY